MKIAHINVIGEIWNGGVSLETIKNAISANADAEQIHVHIHSGGGEVIEGFAIFDALVGSGKVVHTFVEGLSGSIASIIMMAGTERHATPNSQIFIHNPFGMTGGDAETIQQYADELKKWESKIADIYSKISGKPIDDFKPLMDKETFLSSEQAKELNLITHIDDVKITASIRKTENQQTQIHMNILNEIKALKETFKKMIENNLPKNLVVADKDGNTFKTDSDEPIAKGQTLTKEDGTPALADGGEIKLADDTIITVDADGKITDVKPSVPSDETMDSLKLKITELENKLAENTMAETEIAELKNLVSKYKPIQANQQFRKPNPDDANRVIEAKERRTQYKNKN